MWALEHAWVDRRRPVWAGTPFPLVAALGATSLVAAVLTAAGWLPASGLRVAATTAAHGGLLAIALAWAGADVGWPMATRRLIVTVGMVGAAMTASVVGDRVSALVLAAPVWVAWLAVRGRLVGLGLGRGISPRAVLAGAAIGALLGGHLLFSGSQTLGHPVRGWDDRALLALWGYDVGVNVLAGECFFRGALFNRLQRRWSFAAAAAIATTAFLMRYLVDPLIPRDVEVMAGALLYLTMLGAANCWLLSWSGSLVPGLIASLLFFAAYRALAIG